jgi:hypothetical protein
VQVNIYLQANQFKIATTNNSVATRLPDQIHSEAGARDTGVQNVESLSHETTDPRVGRKSPDSLFSERSSPTSLPHTAQPF